VHCLLSYVRPKDPIDWKHLVYKWTHPSPKGIYYYVKNRLFRRYDLIRTGLPKGSWCDIDYKMEAGIMGLLVSYIEEEECFERVDLDYHKLPDSDKTIGDEIRDLYTAIKVTIPQLEQQCDESLGVWASNASMFLKDEDGRKVIDFEYKSSKEESDRQMAIHSKLELEVIDVKTDVLMRIVKVRKYLWT